MHLTTVGGVWLPSATSLGERVERQMNRAVSVVLAVAVLCGFAGTPAGALPGSAGVAVQATPGSVVDIELTWDESGYWLLRSSGSISGHGGAPDYGDAAGQLLAGEQAVSMSAKPGGGGYWIFTTLGRVLSFGTAQHFGDMSGVQLNGPVLDSVATPTGLGYYMVATDGGVFTFGDARFYGSMGGIPLNGPVNGLAPTADNQGYWLVADDGGIFSFGTAVFYGSMGGTPLNKPVVTMVGQGNGYLMVGADGGIFNFGQSLFHGSLGGNPPASPVVAVAPKRDLSGYRMVTAAGGVHAFGNTGPIPDPDPTYEVPTAPQNLAGAQVGETPSVSLTFDAPANAAVANISSYEASCDASGSGSFVASDASSPITVDVEVGRRYDCRVRAVGSEGAGAWANAANVAVAHSAPANVQVVAGDGEMTVSWDAVDSTNLEGYGWITSPSPDGMPLSGTGDVGPGTTSVTVDGLANGEAVWVTVYAESSAANVTSELSEWVSATPTATPMVTVPSAPQSAASVPGDGAEISVSFTAPADNGGAAIDNYEAVCAAGTETFTETGAGSPLVVDVEYGLTYECQVRAHNSEGWGPWRDAHGAPVPHPAPANLAAVAGDGEVALSWDAVPAENFASYTVQSAPAEDGPWADAATGVTTTSTTVDGLVNGTEVWFRVAALSTVPLGSDSSAVVSATPAAPGSGPDVSNPGDLARISVSSAGSQLDEGGQLPPVAYARGSAVSADGRYVLFTSEVPGLVGGDLFVRDTVVGTTTPVVDMIDGNPPEGSAYNALLSSDGRHVAFAFAPYEDGDPVGGAGLYVRDMDAGTTELVSIDPSGNPYGSSTLVGISENGRSVYFAGDGTDQLPGELRVRDRDTGTTEVLDLAGPDRHASVNGAATHVMMSSDGRYLAIADNPAFSTLFPLEGRGTLEVVLIDSVTDEVFRVSPPLPSDLPEGAARLDSVQGVTSDGRYVLYQSSLLDWSAPFPWPYIGGDLLLFDRVTGTRTVVAESYDGEPLTGPAGGGGVSDDGRYVAFMSEASNIVAGDDNGVSDVFVRDMVTGTTIIVPALSESATNGGALTIGMSADGSRVVFTSAASNLVDGDTNAANDVFLHVLDQDAFTESLSEPYGPNEIVNVGAGGEVLSSPLDRFDLSADGRYAAFSDGAGVYVRDTRLNTTALIAEPNLPGGGQVTYPSISADGRRVVFLSNLGTVDDPGAGVHLHDLDTGVTRRVSVGDAHDWRFPSISADGTKISYLRVNSRPGEDRDATIYLYDTTSDTTTAVLHPSDWWVAQPEISGDGQTILFNVTVAPSGMQDLSTNVHEWWLYDIPSGEFERASTRDPALSWNTTHGAISDDGDTIAYCRHPDGPNGAYQQEVVLHDRGAETTRVLAGPIGNVACEVSFSGDGEWVAYEMRSNRAHPYSTNDVVDIVVESLADPSTRRVLPVSADGDPSDQDSRNPTLSYDGTRMLFWSHGRNLASIEHRTSLIGWDLFVTSTR